jgi:hypothetical protein
MDFVTIEELAKASGKSRRTVDRKIKAYLKVNSDKEAELLRPDDIPGGRILYHPQILSVIGISKSLVAQVKAEIIAEAEVIPVVKEKPKKEPKERKPRKPRARTGGKRGNPAYNPEPAKLRGAGVISVDQMPDDEQNQLADFNLVIEEWKTGHHTLPHCISMHGIDQKTFFYWVNSRPIFNQIYTEAYEEHKHNFNVLLREMAKESLVKMVKGYDVTMESVTYKELISPTGEPIRVPMERKMHQKHVLPNQNLIVFALTNKDPDEWKRFFNPQDQQNRNRQPDPLEQMTDQELMDLIEDAKRQGFLTTGDISGQNQQQV